MVVLVGHIVEVGRSRLVDILLAGRVLAGILLVAAADNLLGEVRMIQVVVPASD